MLARTVAICRASRWSSPRFVAGVSTTSEPMGRIDSSGQSELPESWPGATMVALPPRRAASTARFHTKAARTTSRSPMGTAMSRPA